MHSNEISVSLLCEMRIGVLFLENLWAENFTRKGAFENWTDGQLNLPEKI